MIRKNIQLIDTITHFHYDQHNTKRVRHMIPLFKRTIYLRRIRELINKQWSHIGLYPIEFLSQFAVLKSGGKFV